jgi:FixJ family two-component response regulator
MAAPVVISSGYGAGALDVPGLGDGDVVFLQKPFTSQQLATALAAAIAPRAVAAG